MKSMKKRVWSMLLIFVMAISMITGSAALAFAATPEDIAEENLIEYTGDIVTAFKDDGTEFGMWTPQDGTTAVLNGDTVDVTYIPKRGTYVAFYWGLKDDAEKTNDVELIEGRYSFSIDKKYCGKKIPIAPIKADGNTTDAQIYFCIPSVDKLRSSTEEKEKVNVTFKIVDGDQQVVSGAVITVTDTQNAAVTSDAEGVYELNKNDSYTVAVTAEGFKNKSTNYVASASEEAVIELEKDEPTVVDSDTFTVENKYKMFKVVYAALSGEEQKTLTVRFSGDGYHYLYLGRYEQALATNGDKATWIEGRETEYVNDNDKKQWEFDIPIKETDTFIPLIAISQSKLDNFEQGKGDFAEALFPRMFLIDWDTMTLTTDDLKETISMDLDKSNAGRFGAKTTQVYIVGAEVSNNYKADLLLTMSGDSYDYAYVGTAEEALSAEEADKIALDDNKCFTIPFAWKVNNTELVSYLNKDRVISFHSVSKDSWYEKFICIDDEANKVTITEVTDANKEAVKAVQDLIDAANGTFEKAADMQAAVDAAKAAYEALDDNLKLLIPNAQGEIETAQNAADAKAAQEAAAVVPSKETTKPASVQNTNTETVKKDSSITKVSPTTKKIKVKKLKKKKQTFKLKVTKVGDGQVTFKKISGNKKIKVSKNGKVTVKKGLKKKTYKVKVKITMAETQNYKSSEITKTIKIKVK